MSAIGDIIMGGGAFVNPLKAGLSSIEQTFDATIAAFDLLVIGNPLWSNPQDVLDAKQVLNETKAALSSFGIHTDRLSGVGGGEPSLATIANVVNTAKNATGDTTCDAINNAFGSLAQGASLVNNALGFIQDIQSFITGGPAALSGAANNIRSSFINMIQQDLDAFLEAQQRALIEAFGNNLVGLLGDGCMASIIGGVATPALKNALQEKASQARNLAGDALRDNIPRF